MGSLMDFRRRILMAGLPDYLQLPTIYEKLPYVIADGNQAIRTDYVPVRYDEFHLRLNGAQGTILSAGVGTYQTILISGFSSTGWYCRYFSSLTHSVQANYIANTWYDVDIDSTGIVTTNGQTFSCPPDAVELDGTATNLYLFERRNWSSRYSGSVSEFWIKNNGKYKMYLIPCRRKSDQKVGMYDTISKTFFTSPSGRNDFIAGT